MAFTIANIPYTFEAVTFQDWAAAKPNTPFNYLPNLRVDGEVLCQSSAILRYVCNLGNIGPSDPLDLAKVDSYLCALEECRDAISPTLHMGEEEKLAARQALITDGVLRRNLTVLENLCEGRQWFVGDDISAADLSLYTALDWIHSGILDGIPAEWPAENFPNLWTIRNNVQNYPGLASYFEEQN